MDDKASDEQQEALLKVYTGKAGGPVADEDDSAWRLSFKLSPHVFIRG
ncbi:MAG: DUF1326 domain-containing protein [Xanthobacteraceae bacterium]